MIQVCKKTECDSKPYTAMVKNKELIFCCQKGFEKSLKEYAKTIKPTKIK